MSPGISVTGGKEQKKNCISFRLASLSWLRGPGILARAAVDVNEGAGHHRGDRMSTGRALMQMHCQRGPAIQDGKGGSWGCCRHGCDCRADINGVMGGTWGKSVCRKAGRFAEQRTADFQMDPGRICG